MAPLRVGIGVMAALYGTRAIHRYVLHLAHELGVVDPKVHYRLFSYRFRKASDARLPRPSPPRLLHCWTPLPGRLLDWSWETFRWPGLELFTGPVDVFHATDFDIPPVARGTSVVFTVHGVNYLAAPETLPPPLVESSRRLLKQAVERSDLFIAVSETTGQQLQEHYPQVEGRVRAVPLGISEEFKPTGVDDEAVLRRWGLDRPYVLFVGSLSRIKNVPTLLRGFQILREQYPGENLELVLAGPLTPGEEDVGELLREAQARGEARMLGNLPQGTEDLPALYRNALVFGYPSRSEGWTSPPLEAMASATPVVVSNVSSLPETVGDAALMVDPDAPEELAEQMGRLIFDSDLRDTMVERGLKWSGRFTWRRVAEKTLEVYREAANR